MTLLIHICIAFSSVGYSTYAFLRPSQTRLHFSYVLIASTVASGTALLIQNPAHMIEACSMGLLFISVTSLMTVLAHGKLAAQKIRKEN